MSYLTQGHTITSTHTLLKKGDSLYLAMLIVLFWLPLPLGSFQPLYSGIMSCLISGLFLIWSAGLLLKRYSVSAIFIKAWPVILLWVLWVGYLLLQILPLPISWVETLSPTALDWHLRSTPSAVTATLSINPYATTEALLKSISYLLLFSLILLMTRRSKHIRWLAYAIIFSGLFQALYGSFMVLIAQSGDASGTFFTRNLFAGYIIMSLSVGIGLLLSQLEQQEFSNWRQRIRYFLSWILGEKMRLRIYLAIMVIALVLTHSRMGNASFFIALTVTGVIALLLSWYAPRSMIILLVSLLIIDVVILGAWFGLDKVADRLKETVLEESIRVDLNQYTLRYWQDYPLTGSGLGSFKEHFQGYQGVDIVKEFHYAHNDYLQMGGEVGIIGLVLLGLPVLLNLILVLRGMYHRKRPLIQGITFATTMSAIALALHSTVDYNLQLPSNAATFMAILAMGLAATHLPSHQCSSNQSRLHSWRPQGIAAKTGLIIIIGGTALLFTASFIWSQSSLHLKEVRNITRYQKEGQTTTIEQLHAARLQLLQMIKINPGNPSISEELGLLYTQMADRHGSDSNKKEEFYLLALAAFEHATQQQPVDATSWANIVWIKAYLQQYDQALFRAMENALAAGPWRPYPVSSLAEVGLLLWPILPQASHAAVITAFDRALILVPERAKEWSKEGIVQQRLCSHPGEGAALQAYCKTVGIAPLTQE